MKSLFPYNTSFIETDFDFSTRNKFLEQKKVSNLLLIEASNNLGFKITDVQRDVYGAPILSDELIGTTSHSHNKIVAVVSEKKYLKGIGVDIQKIKLLNPKIAKKILTPSEYQYSNDNLKLLIIFSIKEAIYKSYYIATAKRLNWQSVSITLDNFDYRIEFTQEDENIDICGNFLLKDGYIISSAYSKK